MSTPRLSTRHPVALSEAVESHALRMNLPGPVDVTEIRERLREIDGSLPLWLESVPPGADATTAARWRDREMTRPVSPGRTARVVLLRYAGGGGDLLLVARRTDRDYQALYDLASYLRGGDRPNWEPSRGARAAGPPSTPSPRPAWGLGDPAAGLAWAGSARSGVQLSDLVDWATALVVVAAQYDSDAPVAVGDGHVLHPATLREAGPSLHAVRAAVAERLSAPFSWPAGPRAAVGLLCSLAADPDVEYLASLAPAFALMLVLARDGSGSGELRWQHLLRDVSPVAAQQLVDCVIHVHSQLLADPATPLAAVEPLAPHWRERIVALGAAPQPLTTTPTRLPELFGRQVAAHPSAIAVSDERGEITYAQLDRWTDRLACGLRALGVRHGDLVGVALERSTELIAVLLAVLKAGAAYVPLDLSHPAERMLFTVQDAGPSLVVAGPSFPETADVRRVDPAEVEKLGAHSSGGAPAAGGDPSDAAYVIYTSGSTGRPKGVLVSHANVAALLDATRDEFGLGVDDVWTFFHSAAFDFSVWEIWGCLLTGGRLAVVPYWTARSPEQLHQLLVDQRVTVLSQTPSAFTQLLEADRAADRALDLRLVVLGGEPLDARALLPWFDRHPESGCRLVNMFGITETTVHVTATDVTRAGALAATRSVGRPLPGWYVRIRDESGRMAPVGVPGEIHVGGAGVAIGYLNRPELTAERFLTDPITGTRTYRSGDRGRLLPDGSVEHLGRLDDQVKVRGFRIELEEIRLVLCECPGVAAAAVTLRCADAANPATKRIDAYVVPVAGVEPRVAEYATRILPDYMRPATVTLMSKLPTTVNGKVDRSALPLPSFPAKPSGPVPADNDLLAALAEVWQEVFGHPVSASDNFFELGGNSLLAVRMAAAMRSRGMPALLPQTLYLYPTLTELADALCES